MTNDVYIIHNYYNRLVYYVYKLLLFDSYVILLCHVDDGPVLTALIKLK